MATTMVKVMVETAIAEERKWTRTAQQTRVLLKWYVMLLEKALLNKATGGQAVTLPSPEYVVEWFIKTLDSNGAQVLPDFFGSSADQKALVSSDANVARLQAAGDVCPDGYHLVDGACVPDW